MRMNVSERMAKVQEDPEATSKIAVDVTSKMVIEVTRAARQVHKGTKVVETRVINKTNIGRTPLGRKRSQERY